MNVTPKSWPKRPPRIGPKGPATKKKAKQLAVRRAEEANER